MNNINIKPPKIMKRTMAKDFETLEKERQKMIAKMTPSERSEYLKDYEETFTNVEEIVESGLLYSTAPTFVDTWEKTIVLNKDNLKGTTFVSKDESGYMVSIDISRGEGELPKADKNIYFVLGIPLNMKCKWKIIPETKTSMQKIHFEEIRIDDMQVFLYSCPSK